MIHWDFPRIESDKKSPTIYLLNVHDPIDPGAGPFQTQMIWMIELMGLYVTLCTYRLNWAMRTLENGEMNEMTLPFGHRNRNSIPGGPRRSTLPLGHGGSPRYWIFTSEREVTWNLNARAILRSQTFQTGRFSHCTGARSFQTQKLRRQMLVSVFSYKLRYIVGFRLVELAISTNLKPTI